jgi:hypothetical protein
MSNLAPTGMAPVEGIEETGREWGKHGKHEKHGGNLQDRIQGEWRVGMGGRSAGVQGRMDGKQSRQEGSESTSTARGGYGDGLPSVLVSGTGTMVVTLAAERSAADGQARLAGCPEK